MIPAVAVSAARSWRASAKEGRSPLGSAISIGSGKRPVRSASKAAAVAAVAQAPVVQPRRKGPSGLRAMEVSGRANRVPAHPAILGAQLRKWASDLTSRRTSPDGIMRAMSSPEITMRRPDFPSLEPGWVWLVGAGPGDPGLITLLAAKALGEADVVVYDALVGEAILAMARPGAELEYAGKRGGKPSIKQPDISLRLIQLGREGKRVLRLKGGDPMVFGRGGEEALALVAAKVPFRSVSG